MGAQWGARITGGILVASLALLIADAAPFVPGDYWPLAIMGAGAVFGALIAPVLARPLVRWIQRQPGATVIAGGVGLLIGLASGALLSVPISSPIAEISSAAGTWLPLMLTVALGLGGMLLAGSHEWRSGLLGQGATKDDDQVLVDTSAIIDGRIADVIQAGFLKATLLIPRFVLDELRHVADSPDSMRRTRGRRGLDVLNRLRNDLGHPVQVLDIDIRDIPEVDAKLVRLAENLGVGIVTTDFNLNRVAEIQGVQVLNVNDLAQALKPVALPGEVMDVHIVQQGKENGQGVAYLDDGTMVVVENGDRLIGQDALVTVSRMLQTSAGRIIFAQPNGN
ncbi:MAG: PIN domain-containing protein [Dehalococcoidia bacterium]